MQRHKLGLAEVPSAKEEKLLTCLGASAPTGRIAPFQTILNKPIKIHVMCMDGCSRVCVHTLLTAGYVIEVRKWAKSLTWIFGGTGKGYSKAQSTVAITAAADDAPAGV